MWQILLYLLLSSTPPAFDVQTLDGRIISGSLVELNSDRLSLETGDGNISFPTEKILELSPKPKPAVSAQSASVWIELVDGSTIAAKQYTVEGAKSQITLLDDEVLETPVQSIRNVRLQPESEEVAKQWSRILADKVEGDTLVVRKGENLDYHQGVLRNISPDVVQFQLDAEDLPVKRAKIYGFIYRHSAGGALPSPICHLIDTFGSSWQVSKISLEDKLHWTTPLGLTLSRRTEDVAHIDFSQGKIIYLSDLKPESIVWTPFFSLAKNLLSLEQFYAPRQDRNFESSPLQLDRVEYNKGLAIHSRTELIYRLPASFSHLKAIAGIDDSVRPHGNVRLVIRGDNNVLFDTPIAGTDDPNPIDLDITGIRRLSILVDFGDQAGYGDNLDLCNLRITK
jgi:hypothetical protein